MGPDFVKPDPNSPAQWSQPLDAGLETTTPDLAHWWYVFEDETLNQLVETARRNNNELEIAGLRVLEARAQLGIATGSLYPQSQYAAGDARYVSPADNTGITSGYGQYALEASIAWEIDFWGRFRRGVESADAAFLASISAYDQALVLLTAAVVDTYIVIRATQEQLRIADENVAIQQRSYAIADVLYRNGADSELDMQQAKTLLLATKATIPALQVEFKQACNALSTLLGQPPGSVEKMLAASQPIPSLPERVEIGFPADMLRRRPDVRRAELQAMAQNAQVGMAEANLYPSFSLFGTIGLSAGGPGNSDFGDLFTTDALNFAIGSSFVWPFLNYGRIKNSVRVQDARLQQALVNYREVVLQSAREAEDAVASYIGGRGQTLLLAQTVDAAKRSNELSTLRYQEGFSDYQRVLDAQQALFTQQQRYASVQGETVRSLVDLYKSLGGGWESRDDSSLVSPDTREVMIERTDWGGLIEATERTDTEPSQKRSIDW